MKSADTPQNLNPLFPVFLKLENMRLLVVGGGNVALEKLNAVLNNSPHTQIKVVAPSISLEIKRMAASLANIQLIERRIEPDDIQSADLVIAAVNDIEVSIWISATCRVKGKLVNVADNPPLCDFYLGSIVQKGDLKIAISTNGKSPSFAKRLKEMLQQSLPDVNELMTSLSKIRSQIEGDFSQRVKRLTEITRALSRTDVD